MNPTLSQKKIPGLLGLFVVVLGLGITVYLGLNTTQLFQHAAPSETPNTIRITNVSDTAFTLTYQTDTAFVGTMTIGDTDTQTILDDRDQQSGTPHPYILHSITAKNLQPSTSYKFSILSGKTTFLNNNQKFTVSTVASVSASPSLIPPLAGRIVVAGGTQPSEALVFATVNNGQTLSTLTDSSGLYVLPLNTMRSKDLSSFIALSASTQVEILALGPTDTAHATVTLAGSNPVADITLGQNYDFTSSTIPIASSSAIGGFPAFSLDQSLRATPQILSPAKENQGYTDQQPLFKGTAGPNEEVTITIHSTNVITKKVTADANGNWSFRPSTPLSPGVHTITISTQNSSGILQTIQKTFTVYAAGSQVNQSATPSGSLIPTATVTPSPTPTAIPTIVISPTPTLTTTASSVTITPTKKPQPTLPPTGSNATIVIGIVGIITTLAGMMVFFLTKGATL